MGTDILLKVTDQLFPVLNILDDEQDAHRKGEQYDQTEADLKTKAFIKLGLFHRPFIRTQDLPVEAGTRVCSELSLVAD
jgi:hypothetical protein